MLKRICLSLVLMLVSYEAAAQDFYGSQTRNATIAINTSLSGAVDITGCTVAGIIMSAGWDTASITAQASVDGTNFYNLYDEFATEVTVSAAASRFIRLSPADWWGVRYVKLRSGTSGTAVNQTAARTLKVVCR